MKLLTSVILWAILLSVSSVNAKPLAMALPLTTLTRGPDALKTSLSMLPTHTINGRLVIEGPSFQGTRGEGLTVATALSQLLQSLGIPCEITCAHLPAIGTNEVVNTIHISLSKSLAVQEEQKIVEALAKWKVPSSLPITNIPTSIN